jgi:hypothetical protein
MIANMNESAEAVILLFDRAPVSPGPEVVNP